MVRLREITFVKKLHRYEYANRRNEKEIANVNSADACTKTIKVKKYYYYVKITFIPSNS